MDSQELKPIEQENDFEHYFNGCIRLTKQLSQSQALVKELVEGVNKILQVADDIEYDTAQEFREVLKKAEKFLEELKSQEGGARCA